MTILLVTGSRRVLNEASKALILKSLERAEERWGAITLLFVGEADGVDAFVTETLEAKGVEVRVYQADWLFYGRSAGPKRNAMMVEEAAHTAGELKKPLRALAFPCRQSHAGTMNCVTELVKAGVGVVVVPLP